MTQTTITLPVEPDRVTLVTGIAVDGVTKPFSLSLDAAQFAKLDAAAGGALSRLIDDRRRELRGDRAVLLDVPYVSQMSSTANYAINDCGAACVAMLAQAAGYEATVNEVYWLMGLAQTAKGALLNTLSKAMAHYDLRPDLRSGMTVDAIRELIDIRQATILLVEYDPVEAAHLHWGEIGGLHYVVAVGYDDGGITVHDPYFPGVDGAAIRWPDAVMDAALAGAGRWAIVSELEYGGLE